PESFGDLRRKSALTRVLLIRSVVHRRLLIPPAAVLCSTVIKCRRRACGSGSMPRLYHRASLQLKWISRPTMASDVGMKLAFSVILSRVEDIAWGLVLMRFDWPQN